MSLLDNKYACGCSLCPICGVRCGLGSSPGHCSVFANYMPPMVAEQCVCTPCAFILFCASGCIFWYGRGVAAANTYKQQYAPQCLFTDNLHIKLYLVGLHQCGVESFGNQCWSHGVINKFPHKVGGGCSFLFVYRSAGGGARISVFLRVGVWCQGRPGAD